MSAALSPAAIALHQSLHEAAAAPQASIDAKQAEERERGRIMWQGRMKQLERVAAAMSRDESPAAALHRRILRRNAWLSQQASTLLHEVGGYNLFRHDRRSLWIREATSGPSFSFNGDQPFKPTRAASQFNDQPFSVEEPRFVELPIGEINDAEEEKKAEEEKDDGRGPTLAAATAAMPAALRASPPQMFPVRAGIMLPPRLPSDLQAELAAESLSGAPRVSRCTHAFLSDCLKLTRDDFESLGALAQLSSFSHQNLAELADVLTAPVQAATRLPNCVKGDWSPEEDRHAWMEAKAKGTLAQYSTDRQRRIESIRAQQAAVLLDPRLLHGEWLPESFGAGAAGGVEPLSVNFGVPPPVVSNPPTLGDLAAMAAFDDSQLQAEEAARDAYVRAHDSGIKQAARGAVFTPLSYHQGLRWELESAEWQRPIMRNGQQITCRTEILSLLEQNTSIAQDLLPVIADYLQPPIACEIPRVGVKPDRTFTKHLRLEGRVVGILVDASVGKEGLMTFKTAWHPDALRAARAVHLLVPHEGPDIVCQMTSLLPLEGGVKDHILFALPVPAEMGVQTISALECRGYRSGVVYGATIFSVVERKSRVDAPIEYDVGKRRQQQDGSAATVESKEEKEEEKDEVEDGWLECAACLCCYRDTVGGVKGVCSARGAAGHEATLNKCFSLRRRSSSEEDSQGGWSHCDACSTLFHSPSQESSVCAASPSRGPHHLSNISGRYLLDAHRPYEPSLSGVSGERLWRPCVECAAAISPLHRVAKSAWHQCPARVGPRGNHKATGQYFSINFTPKEGSEDDDRGTDEEEAEARKA